jgi:Fe-S-cluster-containing dehydrogenase component
VVTGGAAEGAVVIDQDLCKPYIGDCFGQCQIYCPRGGYPKIGSATDDFLSITLDYKAWKCHLCYPHIKAGTISQPECVNACTAAALSFGDKATIEAQAQTFANYCGDGSVYWASNEHAFLPPKADPLVEDHISPMIGRILESPAGKLAVVPALLVGGLYALYQRRLSAEK